MLLHPAVARRDCKDCQDWMYDDEPVKGRWGLKVERGGGHIRRLKGMEPPCRWCPKIPAGVVQIPRNAVELSERNAAAYMHYRRCKAVGRFPVDPIVERNAALILAIEEEVAAERAREAQLELVKHDRHCLHVLRAGPTRAGLAS